jgi:hypothetical protein
MKSRIGIIVVVLLVAGCDPGRQPETPALVGAWRSTVQFSSGTLATLKDLEFMYVFNAGGTLTESSNYDGSPPVPPAYGVWRPAGPREFEVHYEYYATTPPPDLEELRAGGWLPAGRGVFTERIALSEDGQSFASTIRYEPLDSEGKPADGGGEALGRGTRIRPEQ